LPAESKVNPSGVLSNALVAGPPSPENRKAPPPAIVVIVPPDTFRIRLLLTSAM
jgi:hypothetical protein